MTADSLFTDARALIAHIEAVLIRHHERLTDAQDLRAILGRLQAALADEFHMRTGERVNQVVTLSDGTRYQRHTPMLLVRWECPVCGKESEKEAQPGRTPRFCSVDCRLAARAEQQRQRRAAQKRSRADTD